MSPRGDLPLGVRVDSGEPGTKLHAYVHLAEEQCDFIHRLLAPQAAEAGTGRASSLCPHISLLFFPGCPGALQPGGQPEPLASPPHAGPTPNQPEAEASDEVSGNVLSGCPPSQRALKHPRAGTHRQSSHGLSPVRPLVILEGGEEKRMKVTPEFTQDRPGSLLTLCLHALHLKNIAKVIFVLVFKNYVM